MDALRTDDLHYGPIMINRRQLMGDHMANDTQAPMLLGVSGSILFLAVLLFCARLWSRLRPTFNLHMEDWTALGALILAMIKYLLVCMACAHGFGRHAEYVSPESRLIALRLIFFCQVIFNWSITLVKLSVAILLLRLKPTRRWRIFLFSTMAILVLTAVVQTFFQFLQCQPFSLYWDPSTLFRSAGVQCVPQRAIIANIIAGSAVHVSTDLIFSFIPITFIRKLHRPRGEKIFLCVLMGLGLSASSFAILRTVWLNTFYSSQDFFRTSVMPTLWAMLEQEVALVAATMPTLKSFIQRNVVKIGRYFYDKDTETQVRNRLVELGFLEMGNEEEWLKMGRKLSKPVVEVVGLGGGGTEG